MRRAVIRIMALAGLLVTAVGCADAPTAPNAANGSRATTGDVEISASVFLDPVIVRGCDPTITECEDDAGWDSCAAGGVGTSAPEMGSIEGCGGGGSGAGGDGGGPGSGGGGDGTPSDPTCTAPALCEDTAFEEGPLLWGACVLAVLGSAYTIDQVAGSFQSWWDTQREYESAKRTYDAIQANPASVTPEMAELWAFRVEYARNRRNAAMDDVSDKTNTTWWALAGAAVACGAAAFAPTP